MGGTDGMPPVNIWQQVAATRPEIQSLDPSINICLSEMHVCKNSERITLLHGFTHVEIALKAQINVKLKYWRGGLQMPPTCYLIVPPILKKP